MKKTFLFIFLAYFISGTGFSPACQLNKLCDMGEVSVLNDWKVEKVLYSYHVPEDAGNKPLPVLIGVGGLNDSGMQFMESYWKDFADKNNLVVLALNFKFSKKDWLHKRSYQYPRAWSGKALRKILGILGEKGLVDPNSLYLFGMSAGAQFVTRFALLYPDRCEAVTAHAAGGYDLPEKYVSTRFLITVGELDNEDISRVEFAKEFVRECRSRSIDVEFKIMPGLGHQHSGEQNDMSQAFIAKVLTENSDEIIFEKQRHEMVKFQIKSRGVSDQKVLDAMMNVKRHLFVFSEFKELAYRDHPLPIGYRQTISQPYIVAYMTEAARLSKDDKVLEIGTGSGYQAAVLAEIVKEVYTVEIKKPLADMARERLQKLRYKNIHVKHGDGYKGWLEFMPFDVIMVTAAPEKIPEALVEQLKIGGRMVVPVGSSYQELYVLTKTEKGLDKKKLIPVRFVPMVRE